jgi:hypothetical protein
MVLQHAHAVLQRTSQGKSRFVSWQEKGAKASKEAKRQEKLADLESKDSTKHRAEVLGSQIATEGFWVPAWRTRSSKRAYALEEGA